MRYGRQKFLESSEKKIVPKDEQRSETDFALNLTISRFLVFKMLKKYVLVFKMLKKYVLVFKMLKKQTN